jgi:hypothetical protein
MVGNRLETRRPRPRPRPDRSLPNARLIKVRLLDTGQELGASYLDLDLRRPQ